VGTAHRTEDDLLVLNCQVNRKPLVQVHLARNSTDHVTALESQDVDMDAGDPLESSGAQRAATTSELDCGEAMILKEDASTGDGSQIPEELWHARLGHLNRGDLRTVLRQLGTPYRPLSSQELQATPRCPACMSRKQHQKRNFRRIRPHLHHHDDL
jgi:hypothetical protein